MANGTDTPADGVATVIIGQHVRDEDAEAFEAWQTETNDAASGFPGFLGAEVTRPTTVQPDWTVVYRFDSVVHVQNWLNSATRQDLLDRGADRNWISVWDGLTPLGVALREGADELAAWLRGQGAKMADELTS